MNRDINITRNISLLTDFYEFTMINGYLENKMENKIVYFDMFFRKIPDNGGFAIMSGLGTLIEYLKNLRFSDDDIEYLREQKIFNESFFNYLKNFELLCDMWAVKEGTPIFPGEPILIVRGPIAQVQLIETVILFTINHQSLITTKANRIVRAAKGRDVIELGARRAMGADSALLGARAAFIGGCVGTSLSEAGSKFSIPIFGTMAHSWIQLFDSEYDAFASYAKVYPNNCMLLLDTYNTLESGIKNAIKAFKKEILPRGCRPLGVRIDSGDITYLSKKIRNVLDEEGFRDCKICASNSLDEYIIRDMLIQGAEVDIFGVGEKLITAVSDPIFGGVYKLCAVEEGKKIISKIKISENVNKITTPGVKTVWRLYDNHSKKAVADVITFKDEIIDNNKSIEIFDQHCTWKRKVIKNFYVEKILKRVLKKGKVCYNVPELIDIRKECMCKVSSLWDEVKRFENPHRYYVDLSEKLWEEKNRLISKNKF